MEQNRFMICQHPAQKSKGLLWEFAGRKVEEGETKEGALRRECFEELGVSLSGGSVFAEVVHQYPDVTIRLTLFNASLSEGIPKYLLTERPDRNAFFVSSVGLFF